MPEHVLITGSMRSGTTFVGNVLSQYEDLFYLHEPFNKVWGIQGIEHWFPYAHDGNNYADLADRLLEMDVTYRTNSRSGPLKQIVKSLVGGRLHWRAWYYRLVARYSTGLLIKDPLAALTSRYFHHEHDVAVVVLVRHPLAFFYSNKRLGWDFNLSEFRDQETLVDHYLQDERKLLEKDNLSYVQRLGLLWRCVYRTLHEFTNEREEYGNWITVRHEDLCLDPPEQFRRIFSTIEREITPEIDAFISDYSQTDNGRRTENAGHDRIKRNSRSLVDYWKKEVSPDEAHSMRDIVGEAAVPYYDEKSWNL